MKTLTFTLTLFAALTFTACTQEDIAPEMLTPETHAVQDNSQTCGGCCGGGCYGSGDGSASDGSATGKNTNSGSQLEEGSTDSNVCYACEDHPSDEKANDSNQSPYPGDPDMR